MSVIEKREKSKLPEISLSEEGMAQVIAESHEQIDEIFGSNPNEFCNAMIPHCLNFSGRREHLEKDKDYAIAIVAEVAPKDPIEGMLATQMAALQIALIRHSRLMAYADTIQKLGCT